MTQRYRRGGVKQQHSIIPSIRRRLHKIAISPHVQSVTPGRISPATGSQQPVIVFQYFQATGMKLVGKIPGAVQEIFVVTSFPEAALACLTAAGLVVLEENRPGKAHGRNRRPTSLACCPIKPEEASPEIIQRYTDAAPAAGRSLSVPIGNRLNGQRRLLETSIGQPGQKEDGKTIAPAGTASRRRQHQDKKASGKPDIAQASTMEEWLEAADALGANYWHGIKMAKDRH